MFKISYSKDFFDTIDKFISYLKNYYKKIYFDTGIVDHYQIISSYEEKTEKLFDEILNKIEYDINIGYFGEIFKTTKTYELSKLSIKIRSYSIVVIINRKNKYIYIESIFIN